LHVVDILICGHSRCSCQFRFRGLSRAVGAAGEGAAVSRGWRKPAPTTARHRQRRAHSRCRSR
jgi:hypothetical protein